MSQAIRVLLVEDHSDTLLTVGLLLTKRGFVVITSGSVAEGIRVGATTEFDVLVTDIGLPDGDGWEILHALREIKSFPSVAFSGYGTEDDHQIFLAHGFDQIIVKPYILKGLVETLERVYLQHAQKNLTSS